VVDLHHTIYPPTGRYKPRADALFAAAAPIGDSCLKILCPADMVLHCGLHVFAGESMTGLSDLMDLHELLRRFGQDEKFWGQLLARTRLHGLERILYYMLRYTQLVLGTAIPPCAERGAEIGAPPAALRLLMDMLFKSALIPPRAAGRQPRRTIAMRLLYLRAHWLKMPLRLLAYHFCRKMLQSRQKSPTHSFA
jgi:Uncharacterised nucleotidyltransferase